ncbi:hypothetical protein K9N68_37280 (plasmid) [Kovacikia minuta CCNUW1]|uniref:hypothetical protein n=1 Tax=Kovacikia minuta TaxID=2931930 RepID=UPI001CCC3D0D|nr:hypothetical protein [Kovacikia minuta]UBF29866.1 hypothetical protein K9N68_37280 [Kovacikia minuta CCNUW1]
MGRIAGLGSIITPLAFTGLTYGIGRLSGQDNQRALMNAVAGVGGAYAGEALAHRYAPNLSINPSFRGKKIPVSLTGLTGSILGGYAGTGLSEGVDRVARGNEGDGGEVNPLLLAADEFSLPLLNVAKTFF